jgi:hypothetical protein
MEMLVAGCISYAPEGIKEFCIPSVRTYKDQQDLSNKFAKDLDKDDAYFADLKTGREWLSNERDLLDVNELRIKVLNTL